MCSMPREIQHGTEQEILLIFERLEMKFKNKLEKEGNEEKSIFEDLKDFES
jgi:hypothetical protein